MMDIILEIPAQSATYGISRQMRLVQISQEGLPIAEACDALLPARICFSERDNFPWDAYLNKISIFWQLSKNDLLPYAFRLKKNIPEELYKAIPRLSANEALDLLHKLGKLKVIDAFSKLG